MRKDVGLALALGGLALLALSGAQVTVYPPPGEPPPGEPPPTLPPPASGSIWKYGDILRNRNWSSTISWHIKGVAWIDGHYYYSGTLDNNGGLSPLVNVQESSLHPDNGFYKVN